jgi:hypothetical protein
VGKSGSIEIVFARLENLGFSLQSPKRITVNNPISINLEGSAVVFGAPETPRLGIEIVIEPVRTGTSQGKHQTNLILVPKVIWS